MPAHRESLSKFEAALMASLTSARTNHAGDRQQAALAASSAIQPHFKAARAAIEKRFQASGHAAHALEERSVLVDRLIEGIFAFARDEYGGSANDAMAVIAVGGYGRRELFPYSDIDLLFLHAAAGDRATVEISEFILYTLWNLGLKVGHAVRDTAQANAQAKADMTVRTALLDARVVAGEAALFDSLRIYVERELKPGSEIDFVEAKLAERDQRHQRLGDTRYALEPNIKEGKGGLRDLHTLEWIVKYTYSTTVLADWETHGILSHEEMNAYIRARNFLWSVRTHLHLAAGRAEERLTFDQQLTVARAMGFTQEKGPRSAESFMKRYFQTAKIVGTLTRIVCAVLEEEKKRKPRLSLGALLQRQEKTGRFLLDGERLAAADERDFAATPRQWLELFLIAQTEKLDVHPRTLRLITRNLKAMDGSAQKDPESGALFLRILMGPSPEAALRRLNEAGVLGRFIPEFGRVIGQMQYDRYHTLTVDEHTLHAIGMLNAIELGQFRDASPVASDIIHRLESKRVLYLALFCHDIAKGQGGDHSALGEKIARKLAQRFGFSQKEQEDTAWLVKEHLLFSHTAFKRDIGDPATLDAFVARVQSPERLRLLLVLTVADIRAVGPTIWNGWKGALLRDLYQKAEMRMGGGPELFATETKLQAALESILPHTEPEMIEAYLGLGHPAFWSGCDTDEHREIMALLPLLDNQNDFALAHHIDHFRAVTRMTVVTPDQHALFSKVAGAMALAGANIVSAKVFTLKNGIAVEIFGVQNAQGKAFEGPRKMKKLHDTLADALSGRLDFAQMLGPQKRGYLPRAETIKVPNAVFIENTASPRFTVIEVNGRDRIGFLHIVTRELAKLGLNIATAMVSTYGDRAVDVFYVKDIFGFKITHEAKLRQIRETLLAALATHLEKKAA